MDIKQIEQAITAAFGSNIDGFAKAMMRLAKLDELQAVKSKLANVEREADEVASRYVEIKTELAQMIAALQAQLDELEKQ